MNYRKDLLFIINDVEQGTGSGGQQVLDNVAVAVAGGPVESRLSLRIDGQK